MYFHVVNGCLQSELPFPFKKFLDESGENGAILVSFGSVLQASQMSDDLRLKLLNVFSKVRFAGIN